MSTKRFILPIKSFSFSLKNGFTLMELLVVISIIGLLSIIIVTSVRAARNRAKSAAVVVQTGQVEKAFFLSYIEEERATWWTEGELQNANPGFPNNPKISDIIEIESGPLSSFSSYFAATPNDIIADSEVRYDNDSNSSTPDCSGDIRRGVNLIIYRVSWEDTKSLDEFYDNELDGSCGKIRYVRPQASGAICDETDEFCHVHFKLDLDESWD